MANLDNNYNNIINENPTGDDILKGGIFFGSALTPNGAFSNVPKYLTPEQISQKEPSLMLTLQKVKNSLSDSLSQQTGGSANNDTIEKFLYDFVDLLIDYRDMRNYVFYGSANTELAYNIKYIIENYPYTTLVGQKLGNSFIKLRGYIENNVQKTEIIFPETFYHTPNDFERVIIDNYNKFNFYDSDQNFNWQDFEIVNKNGKRYSIEKVVTPYKSPTIFKVTDIETISATAPNSSTYSTIKVTTDQPHGYVSGQQITMKELNYTDPSYVFQYKVKIWNGSSYDYYHYNMNDEPFEISNVTSTTFELRRFNGLPYESLEIEENGLAPFYDSATPGLVRLYPEKMNTRPYVVKINIIGNFVADMLMDFDFNNTSYKGFMIAPLISIVNEWDINLSPIQRTLLAPTPINPTPWPRRTYTNNPQNILSGEEVEEELKLWLNNPSTLYVKGTQDPPEIDQAYGFGLQYEVNMLRALALDETYSNQLVRRSVPDHLISELNDTDDAYFQRFILIAGWMFDQIRLYVKFLKYAHTVNHTDYNQLSPQYYRYLASYFGLDLFNDDSIDFSKLVVQTVPGSYYGVDPSLISTNKYYQKTLQQLQFDRQKNLLMSLIYLYKKKGTHDSIKQLIALLGAPDGLLLLNEYVFSVDDRDTIGYPKSGYKGQRLIDNEKVHVPGVSFEVDPDYLNDKNNLDSYSNKPFVYKPLYDNEYVHNLRELSVNTDPNNAIDNQIETVFGEQKYNYIKFSDGEFASLQRTGKHYLLPLTLPDRFFGMSVEYMIPRGGIARGVGSNQEEATCNLMALHRVAQGNTNPVFEIVNITFNAGATIATITTNVSNFYAENDNVFINGVGGVLNMNGQVFTVVDIIDTFTFTVFGNFSNPYSGGGTVTSGKLNKIDNTTGDDMLYTYPLAVDYRWRNKTTDTSYATDSSSNPIVDGYTNPSTDFDVLYQKFANSSYVEDSYVIARMEGKDLVIRLRIQSEKDGSYGERCAIFDNVFSADGLNHSLRMTLREDGVEIFKDYEYIGIARWINISNAGPYLAYEIPKSEIKALNNAADDCFDYYEPIKVDDFIERSALYNSGLDKINWWDMFIGMPTNAEVYFKKLNLFENDTVNDYNIGDRLTNADGNTAEFFVFEVSNPTEGSTVIESKDDFSIQPVFYEMFPNMLPGYYAYILEEEKDQYDRSVVKDLKLQNKRINSDVYKTLFLNMKQDFFNVEDLFTDNAWMENIHKSYEYELFSGIIVKLYNLYSSQVLTYESLEEFMSLVEQKFKPTIKQFIPIVINLSDFGRLIRNSAFNQAKVRFINSDKLCSLWKTAALSVSQSKVFRTDNTKNDGMTEGLPFYFYLETGLGNIITGAPLTVSWNLDRYLTMVPVLDFINNGPFGITGKMVADWYSNQFRITVDYDWFFATFGENPNNMKMVFEQGFTRLVIPFEYGEPLDFGYHGPVVDNCGKTVEFDYTEADTCGTINYSLPKHVPRPPYWYYVSEDKPPTALYYVNELGTNPVWIRYESE